MKEITKTTVCEYSPNGELIKKTETTVEKESLENRNPYHKWWGTAIQIDPYKQIYQHTLGCFFIGFKYIRLPCERSFINEKQFENESATIRRGR